MFYLNILSPFWQLIDKLSWKRVTVSSGKRDLATAHCLYIDPGETPLYFFLSSDYTSVMNPPPSYLLVYFPNNTVTATNATISHSHLPFSHRFSSPYPNLNLNSKTTCRLHTPHAHEVVQMHQRTYPSFPNSVDAVLLLVMHAIYNENRLMCKTDEKKQIDRMPWKEGAVEKMYAAFTRRVTQMQMVL